MACTTDATPATTEDSTFPPTATPSPVPESTATPVPTPTPELSQAEKTERAQEILLSSLDAMTSVESFHFEVDAIVETDTSGFTGRIPLSLDGDFQTPDRVRAVTKLSFGPLFTIETETIAIGDTIYTTDLQTGEFTVAPASSSGFILPNPPEFAAEAASMLGDLEFLNETTLDGTSVFHLRGVLPQDVFGSAEGEAVVDYWVGTEDSLVRKMETKGELSLDEGALGDELGGLSGNASLSMTMTFSAYNEPVTIEAPLVP